MVMLKKVGLWILAVVVGTVVGMGVMTGLHMASGLVYPAPPGLDLMSAEPAQQALMKAWLSTLPARAFLLATIAHALGCASGAAIATLLVRRRSLIPAIIVGVAFTAAGVMNLGEIPHPAWFAFVDLPLYLIGAVIVGSLLARAKPTSAGAVAAVG